MPFFISVNDRDVATILDYDRAFDAYGVVRATVQAIDQTDYLSAPVRIAISGGPMQDRTAIIKSESI